MRRPLLNLHVSPGFWGWPAGYTAEADHGGNMAPFLYWFIGLWSRASDFLWLEMEKATPVAFILRPLLRMHFA